MENRTQRIFLAGLLCLGINAWADDAIVPAADSGQVIEPELDRPAPKIAAIDTENFEVGVYTGILSIEDFGSNAVNGISLTYHVTEDFFFEGDYGRSEGDETSFEKLSGGAPLLSEDDRKYSYYSLSVGWNVLPGEVFIGSKWAFNSAFYLIAGVGGTQFADDNVFTVNFGAGYRLLITDWLAWHIDARDYLYRSSIFGKTQRVNNLEYRTGITVFF